MLHGRRHTDRVRCEAQVGTVQVSRTRDRQRQYGGLRRHVRLRLTAADVRSEREDSPCGSGRYGGGSAKQADEAVATDLDGLRDGDGNAAGLAGPGRISG